MAKNNIDYLQQALLTFNTDKSSQWFGWKKTDDNGDVIANNQRMTYANVMLNDDTATIPSESDVNAKIQEIKDAETAKSNKKASGKAKLKELGLDDAEIKALTGA
jgi:triacylglycerol esterase/lipase EstA (alpha/beta hydrolase family)|tara:strand:- start:124 stop:438 length:315 start_codon:yes stop_codon:yes gene_type:complete